MYIYYIIKYLKNIFDNYLKIVSFVILCILLT